MPAYDAFLLVSFGGPEGRDDVMPFLENVTRGRGVPRNRLEQVAEHYYRFGGVSPINQQCRDLLAAVEKDFAGRGVDLPGYWGNRNWDPYLTDAVAAMAADGRRRVIAFVTSAYSSYSSCRQYLDDIERARAQAGPAAPRIDKLRPYFNHPGFIEPLADAARAAAESLPTPVQAGFDLVFTAHSIPAAMAAASGPPATRIPGNSPRLPGWWPSGSPALDPGGWPTRAAAALRQSPGSGRTSVTASPSWPGPDQAPWSWSRSASPRTTWRSSSTWTSRRPRPPSGSACRWRGRRRPARTPGSSR